METPSMQLAPPPPLETVHHSVSSESSSSKSKETALSKWIYKCRVALEKITDPDLLEYPSPLGRYKNAHLFDFDFFELFFPWFKAFVPAWPVGNDPWYQVPGGGWKDIYCMKEDGPPVVAFICREGVIVALDGMDEKSVRIDFNRHVIGFFTREEPDLAGNLRKDIPPEGLCGSAADVSDWLVSRCVSGMVIAGWDMKTGPSLFHLDDAGKLYQGVLFAAGSCTWFGYSVVGSKNFPCMTISEAAKVARIAIPTAVAIGKQDSGCYDGVDEAGESGEIGASVKVYCIGRDVRGEVVDVDGKQVVIETGGTAQKKRKAEDEPEAAEFSLI